MIKGIVFDLDNTLYDYDACNDTALLAVRNYMVSRFGICGQDFNQLYDSAGKQVKERLGLVAASHNRLLYMQTFLEKQHAFSAEETLNCYHLYWDSFLNQMELEPGVEKMLERCKNSGLKTAICTDLTAQIQFRKIVHLGLDSFIDIIVTSEEAGIEKPDSKIFQLVLNKLSLRADEAMMVGDDFSKDIIGACSVGMKAAWYNKKKLPSEITCKYIEIKNFRELYF